MSSVPKPIVLAILDGWGLADFWPHLQASLVEPKQLRELGLRLDE